MLDPIDGTRAFLAGEENFAHALAVVEQGRVIAGVVHMPAKARTYAADIHGAATVNGAVMQPSAQTLADGAKLLTTVANTDGARDVLLCAITHTQPAAGETAVEVPAAVARALGLDDGRSWIKTDQVNLLLWEKGRIPYGISQARKGAWAYGMIPAALGRQVFEQVREKARRRSLRTVKRD